MKRRGLSLIGLIAVLVAVAIGIGVTVWYLSAILTAEQEATGLGGKGRPNPIEQAQQLQQEINKQAEQQKSLQEGALRSLRQPTMPPPAAESPEKTSPKADSPPSDPVTPPKTP
jgi:uncharacterized protein HemX